MPARPPPTTMSCKGKHGMRTASTPKPVPSHELFQATTRYHVSADSTFGDAHIRNHLRQGRRVLT
jgi:hypothetical protein